MPWTGTIIGGVRESEASGRQAVLTHDTTAEAEHMQVEVWRGMSPVEKARLVSELTRAALHLSLSGIRQRYPDASERECFLRLAARMLGPDLARQVYPDAAVITDLR